MHTCHRREEDSHQQREGGGDVSKDIWLAVVWVGWAGGGWRTSLQEVALAKI